MPKEQSPKTCPDGVGPLHKNIDVYNISVKHETVKLKNAAGEKVVASLGPVTHRVMPTSDTAPCALKGILKQGNTNEGIVEKIICGRTDCGWVSVRVGRSEKERYPKPK